MSEKTLVLMPGLDGTGRLFEPVIPLLEQQFRLTVVTYPNLNSFNDYINCARSQLPAEPGYSILAESFSGPVALALMAQQGDQIGPSVLAATFSRSPLQALTQMASIIPSQLFSIGTLNEYCLDVSANSSHDDTDTAPLPMDVTQQLDGSQLKHRIEINSRIDITAMLPDIQTPLLYLRATRDRIVSEAHAELLQDNLPNLRRVDIDAPHLLLQTRPRECCDHIFRHLGVG